MHPGYTKEEYEAVVTAAGIKLGEASEIAADAIYGMTHVRQYGHKIDPVSGKVLSIKLPFFVDDEGRYYPDGQGQFGTLFDAPAETATPVNLAVAAVAARPEIVSARAEKSLPDCVIVDAVQVIAGAASAVKFAVYEVAGKQTIAPYAAPEVVRPIL